MSFHGFNSEKELGSPTESVRSGGIVKKHNPILPNVEKNLINYSPLTLTNSNSNSNAINNSVNSGLFSELQSDR